MWLIVYSNDHAPLTVRPIYSSSKLKTAQMIFSLVAMIGLEKCCITSACLQWLCHTGERTVARGPLVPHCELSLFFTSIYRQQVPLVSTTPLTVFNSPWARSAHGELLWSVNVWRASCVVRRAASTIALKAYSSYTPGPIDSILGKEASRWLVDQK